MTNLESKAFKENSTIVLRTSSPYHHIDPGFVNRRKIFSIFGEKFTKFYETKCSTVQDHMSELRNDHLLVNMCMGICKKWHVKSLSQALAEGPAEGQLVCSTEYINSNQKVWKDKRVSSEIKVPFGHEKSVFLEFSTKHIFSDTTQGELANGDINSILAEVKRIEEHNIILHPLIIGAPTYDHPDNGDAVADLLFNGRAQYEIFPEDIEEFSELKTIKIPNPEVWMSVMRDLPEKDVKENIAEILGDITKKDWGGEQNDHYSSNITLGGKRTTAAFLLKGPSKFGEMQPRHLGKNADQIYRLSSCPANLLVVQHCHDIGEAVRATLRAFSVAPHAPRHYCFIDGKDTYKLMKAYGKI